MIALIIVGYICIALGGVYLEARFTGDSMAPLWMMWPFFLPVMLIAAAFTAIADLGERHHNG